MSYAPPDHKVQHWQVTKPAAAGRRGMVVAQSRDAALAGVAVLDAGGNAIDAAVATALSLAAVEPWNSGLGGIGFALVHRAGQPRAEVVDFGPRSPAKLEPGLFKLTGRKSTEQFGWAGVEGDANAHGPLSFAIPSAVAGYAHMLGRWGKLPLSEVMAPSVALAKRGLALDWFGTLKVAGAAATLQKYAESARTYLPGGLPRTPAYQGKQAFYVLGKLPDTMERLSHAGLRDFYEGDVAAAIAKDTAELGGVLSAEDLRRCEARITPAQEIAYAGRTLQLAGGLTAAPTMARVLEMMQGYQRPAVPDAGWYAAMARALKAAYVERLAGLGDADPIAAEACTTHLTVCDAEGTMVAMTTTLMSGFGSRVMLPGTGVLINNGVIWFDPVPGNPNSVGPGKRPLTNMLPVILRDGNRPVLAGGASGGRKIMASVTQLVSFVAEFGMDPQTAAHQPRINVSDAEAIEADPRLPPDVLSALRQAGPTEIVEHLASPANYACPNLILDQDGHRTGISDAMSPWSAAVAQA